MKARRRRHVFRPSSFGPSYRTCERCGVQRLFAVVLPASGEGDASGFVTLYRNLARTKSWTSENPGCVS